MQTIVLSPMAGITDAPFRHLARQFGADITISEMLTAQSHLWGSIKSQSRLQDEWSCGDRSKIIQIAGASADIVAEAALMCQSRGAKSVEINMGCPAKKVCNVLAGSALLKDETLVAEILVKTVKAVNIPVMLKTRLGWDENQQNILTIAKIAQDSGIKSLAVHGRTRCDLYNGEARYELVAKVKQILTIPVFVNGDLTTPEKVKQVLDFTKSDGAYIGRAALGQPWIFGQIKAYLEGGSYVDIDLSQKFTTILEHLNLLYRHYGESTGVRVARKHIKWYWQKLFGSSNDLTLINKLESYVAQYQAVKSILETKL